MCLDWNAAVQTKFLRLGRALALGDLWDYNANRRRTYCLGNVQCNADCWLPGAN